jgi:hypothetical protein
VLIASNPTSLDVASPGDVAVFARHLPPVERVTPALEPALALVGAMDHGFSDMGRDELRMPFSRRMSRSGLYSIAAGVVLVAGLLAARDYINAPDDSRISGGSVSLANVAAATVSPVSSVSRTTLPPEAEARTVERMIAERRGEAKRADGGDTSRDVGRSEARDRSEAASERVLRGPSPELERALRGVDGAVKAIDQRTRALTDSATAIRLQAPTFKKVRIADP